MATVVVSPGWQALGAVRRQEVLDGCKAFCLANGIEPPATSGLTLFDTVEQALQGSGQGSTIVARRLLDLGEPSGLVALVQLVASKGCTLRCCELPHGGDFLPHMAILNVFAGVFAQQDKTIARLKADVEEQRAARSVLKDAISRELESQFTMALQAFGAVTRAGAISSKLEAKLAKHLRDGKSQEKVDAD